MRDKRGYRVLCLLACAAVLWGVLSAVTAQAQSGTIQYTVKRGDTLYSIAKAHGVTTEQLQTWNSISDPRQLKVGQVLVIHTTSGSAVSAQAGSQTGNQTVGTQAAASTPLVTTLTVFGVVFLFLIAILSLFDRRRK